MSDEIVGYLDQNEADLDAILGSQILSLSPTSDADIGSDMTGLADSPETTYRPWKERRNSDYRPWKERRNSDKQIINMFPEKRHRSSKIVIVRDESETQGSCAAEDIEPFDLLDLCTAWNTGVEISLISSEKGHRYVSQLNPTLASLKSLMLKIKDPSVLLLQGCDQLLLQQADDFPFEKFKTLTALEISGITDLTSLPAKAISEMTLLQSLNLSHLPIQQLPEDDFLFKLTNLSSLVLKHCPNLHSLPKFPKLNAVHRLDLSYLLIESLPEEFFKDLKQLRWLILRGCSKLRSLPSTKPLEQLEVLDLSYTTFHCRLDLRRLDASLTHVFLRDAKGSLFDSLINAVPKLLVLDLSGARDLRHIHELPKKFRLQALDLSRTGIGSIDFISSMRELRYLILRDCTRLVRLPSMEKLSLEMLDVSGCTRLGDLPTDLGKLITLKQLNLSGCSCLREIRKGVFDDMLFLEKLDLSKTNFNHLPSFYNLISCGTQIILSQNSVQKVPSNLENLVLETVAEIGVHSSRVENLQGSFLKLNELHLVSSFISYDSTFDRFKYDFEWLENFILRIQSRIINAPVSDSNVKSQVFKRHFGNLLVDLKYILGKVDLLESSENCESIKELLGDLMHATDLGSHEFRLDSKNLNELLRLVAKLKLLLSPPTKPVDVRSKKEETRFKSIGPNDKEHFAGIDINSLQLLQFNYDNLTEIQRHCLLYFAVIPPPRARLEIKERTLIHLWYGEGFIDPHRKVEETGQQILKALEYDEFIRMHPETRVCVMEPNVHFFVSKKAKESGQCFMDIPTSWKLWLDYSNPAQKVESFKTVRILFNVNERIVDVKPEWFSKMRNLTVLHLGSWGNPDMDHIEAVDFNFLEELKKMKQLRLLSLEGFAAIVKLPDSVCKLTNLKILNLRDCSYLEELPDGIGSLQNLAHLDLTHCHSLSKLPKGLNMLSKLVVLKGFVISYQVGGQQHRKACTLRDLLKLDNLRKLNLVVNIDNFPNTEDLQVFKEMKNLCSLKITWEKNCNIQQETLDMVSHKALKHSRWQKLKCWEQQQTPLNDTEEPLPSNCFDNLQKLVMCCFPFETAPKWLNPSELHKLEKLYILGGNLSTLLPPDTNQTTWNVESLRLRYLQNLDMDWQVLRHMFPNMTRFHRHQRDKIRKFPYPLGDEWFDVDKYQRIHVPPWLKDA